MLICGNCDSNQISFDNDDVKVCFSCGTSYKKDEYEIEDNKLVKNKKSNYQLFPDELMNLSWSPIRRQDRGQPQEYFINTDQIRF